MTNTNLHKAKAAKNDEFYTLRADIDKELKNYESHFMDKVIYCNCDNPTASQFYKYFYDGFTRLGLKKLITSSYKKDGKGNYCIYAGDGNAEIKELSGNGSFDSPESIDLLKQSDIVVTNPPFSLFRDFIDLLEKHKKDYITVGNLNAITNRNIFPLIKSGRLNVGYNNPKEFTTPDGKTKKFGNIIWYTTFSVDKPELTLTKKYDAAKYPKYDNYDAINVDKVADIPIDYSEAMGVPITFLAKYNPRQFKVVGFRVGTDGKDLTLSGGGNILTTEFLSSGTDRANNAQSESGWQKEIQSAYNADITILDALNTPFINGGKIYKRLILSHV